MTVDPSTRPAILVVEDEPLIRMDVVDMLEDAGFKIYEAGRANEAIGMMEHHKDIGILFTDIEMPGTMNGLKLAAYVRDKWPSVTILIASGAVGIDEAALPEGWTFLPKPYSTAHVVNELNGIAVR